MPNEKNKVLKYNHGEKSMKVPFIIYSESLLEKMCTCQNNPEKSSTTKIIKHTPSGYLLFTQCSFDATDNELDCYRGKDCMKTFCKDLKERATEIMKYERKEVIPLMKKISLMKSKKLLIYAKKGLVLILKKTNIIKSEIIVIILENIEDLLIVPVI